MLKANALTLKQIIFVIIAVIFSIGLILTIVWVWKKIHTEEKPTSEGMSIEECDKLGDKILMYNYGIPYTKVKGAKKLKRKMTNIYHSTIQLRDSPILFDIFINPLNKIHSELMFEDWTSRKFRNMEIVETERSMMGDYRPLVLQKRIRQDAFGITQEENLNPLEPYKKEEEGELK